MQPNESSVQHVLALQQCDKELLQNVLDKLNTLPGKVFLAGKKETQPDFRKSAAGKLAMRKQMRKLITAKFRDKYN